MDDRRSPPTSVSAWILRDCDQPVAALDRDLTCRLGPKGFWRVDKANDGEGWLLPNTLCLADHDLGHDERAKQPQPVASALGPRFLDWQLAQSPEESWAECERHARVLREGTLTPPATRDTPDTPKIGSRQPSLFDHEDR